jgi:hypothetical protein
MAGIFGIALVEMSPAFIAGYERPAVSLVGVMLLAGLGILVLLRIVTCAMHRVVSVGFVWKSGEPRRNRTFNPQIKRAQSLASLTCAWSALYRSAARLNPSYLAAENCSCF